MKDINPRADQYPEYRQAIRELCAQFPNQYWQRIETPLPTRKSSCKR